MTNLRDALASPDALGDVITATISAVDADGTVSVDFGGGRVAARCPVLATYTPTVGEAVQLLRRDSSSWLVLGAVRTSNPTTVSVSSSLAFPFNVTPAASVAANPFVKAATSIRSWRDNEGWYRDDPVQGSFNTRWGYHRGLYFYGSGAFASLAGQTCTSISIRIARAGSGGNSAAEPTYLAPHTHATQPAAKPYFPVAARKLDGVAWSGVAEIALPVAWGQGLIDGVYKGIGHLYLGTSDYALYDSLAVDALSGRLTIGWS